MIKSQRHDIGEWPKYAPLCVASVVKRTNDWIDMRVRTKQETTPQGGWFQAELVTGSERTLLVSHQIGTLDDHALRAFKDSVQEKIERVLLNPELSSSQESAEPFQHQTGAALGVENPDGTRIVIAFAGLDSHGDEVIVFGIAKESGFISAHDLREYSQRCMNSLLQGMVSEMDRQTREYNLNLCGF